MFSLAATENSMNTNREPLPIPLRKPLPKMIPVVLLLASLNLFAGKAEYKVEIKDISPFWYIYLEFQGEYGSFERKKTSFLRECREQNLLNKIPGNPFAIFFDKKKQMWGVGARIEKEITVQPPLKKAQYNYQKTARAVQQGRGYNDFQIAYSLIFLYLDNKGFQFAGPSIHQPHPKPGEAEIEIIVPIADKKNDYMLLENLYSIVLILSLFLCLFFSLFLFTHRKGKPLANKLFAIFLLANALNYFSWLLNRYLYYIIPWPHLFGLGSPFIFLAAPALFFYTKALTQRHVPLKIKHLVHLFPFIFDLILHATRFYLKSPEVKRELLLTAGIFTQSEILIRLTAIDLQIICYITASLISLGQYKKEIKQTHSSTEQISLQWLKIVLWAYLVVHLFEILKRQFLVIVPAFFDSFYYAATISFLVFAMWVVYKGLKHPEIFSGINGQGNRKYAKELLPQPEKERYLKKLLNYMETGKPYLEPSLTLHELARNLSISPYYLSYIINECLKNNFYDFINGYRVRESQAILKSPSARGKTILEVLYDCGFNSKSTFNTAFKKFTGQTPRMYRKSQKE